MTTPKIFVLRSDRLGDVILSSGYLAALADSFPEHRIELWLPADTAACSQVLHPGITVRKLPFDRYVRTGIDMVKTWLETVQAETYEFAVIPQFTLGYPEIVALAYLDFGPRWGFLNRELGARPEWVYREFGPPKRAEADWINRGPTAGPFIHEVDKYRALARQQGLRDSAVEPRLFGIIEIGAKAGLLVWPGAGDESRRWPAERFAAVTLSLAPIKVTIGTVPADPEPASGVLGSLNELGLDCEICYRDPEDLRGTAQWLAGFRRVLTNDTGIAHLAAAAGAAVTAVSGSQHQGRFAVCGTNSLTIFADVPCRQCGGLCIFESRLYPCVADVDAGSVAALMRQNEAGEHRLPSPRTFLQPDRLFRQLVDARSQRTRVQEDERVEFDFVVRDIRNLLRETEGQRDEALAARREAEEQRNRWRDLCREAEQQRDAWESQCRETERQRDAWESQCREAERQRDAWESQCREAERQRDHALAQVQAGDADRDSWQDLCSQAENQRDQWQAMCHAAEAQRDVWRSEHQAFELERQDMQTLLDTHRTQLQRIEELYPWVLHAASDTTSVPRISIITPSFQSGQYLEQTIQSVLSQSYPNFEHIVVDGGSTDETLEILKRHPHVRWISEPDRGQAHAINKGLLVSTGEIIAYLNADDLYRPAAFAEVVLFFSQNPSARIVAGDCDYIDENSNTIGHLSAKYGRQEDLIRYWGWDRWYCIPQQSVFWRRDLLAETGLFDVSLQMVMDYEMWLRIASLTHIPVLKRTLAAFRLTPHSKTGGSTHLMYLEEFNTSRKYWKNLPLKRRIGVSLEARRHLSKKLLDVAEHFSLNDLRPGVIASLLRYSVRHWPLSAFYPRLICTAFEVVARPRILRQIVKSGHRKYLGLKWRLSQSATAEAKAQQT